MVEDDRDCSEVLIQLSAVRSAITSTGKIIMQHHMEHCIVDAIQNNEPERIEELKNAIDQFIK
jgi:DNA-binding FrmR family transcriptional regulator